MSSTTPAASSPSTERLHLLGVRHHGPGSARSVRRALDELRPDVVLVEAPADTNAALGWIGRPGLVPPVALLGYAVAEHERAVFAPFASFSPEWQAVAWAGEHDVAVHAIDLPWSASLAARPSGPRRPDGGAVDPLALLAAAAGEPDPERWWDDVVEHRGDGRPVFDAVADAMTAVRSGTPTPQDEELREAHMRQAIRRALASDAVVAVVCGAWHVPALDLSAATGATKAADAATLRGLPRTKVAVTWVPWTNRRLQRVTGYGAGVAHPGWYGHVFRHPGPEGVARFFVDAARELRAEGLAASPDHVIGASRLAASLAMLRNRPRPGLAEVLDAADAVLGGFPVVHDRLVVGGDLGDVPADAPQVPLARDLAASSKRARLRPDSEVRTLELDVRATNGRRRSHLLHRLRALDVPWGTLEEGRGSSGTFRETWRLTWEPEWSVRLVEMSGHGTTVVAAATSRLRELATAAVRLADATAVVELALLADLSDAVGPAVDAVGRLAASAPDVTDLMDALPHLAETLRYGDVRKTDASALATVFDELVTRVLAGLERATTGLDDEAAVAMVERMSALQAALAVVDHPARRGALPTVLQRVADAGRGHGLLQGRATRLLHDGGAWSPAAAGRRLGRALTPGTPVATGAAFVEGFVAGSGTVLLHDDQLLAAIDEWIASLGNDTFTDVVALLRRTFGAFEPAERRQLGLLLSTGAVERGAVAADDLDTDRVTAGLATVRAMLGLGGTNG